MKLRTLIAVASMLAVVSTPVLARHCPQDMKKIDAALAANPKLSDADLKEVKRLRAEGEKLHNQGNHPQSEETLAKAMKLLKI
jgi:hypothetical protein